MTQAWKKIFLNRFVSVLPLLSLSFSSPFLLSLLVLYGLPFTIFERCLLLCQCEMGAPCSGPECWWSLSRGPDSTFLDFWMSADSQLSRLHMKKTATFWQSLWSASSSPFFFLYFLVWCESFWNVRGNKKKKKSFWKWRNVRITKKPPPNLHAFSGMFWI